MIESLRTFPINPLPVELGVSEHELTRGMVENGVVISALFSSNLSGAGAAVRARALPVRTVSLVTSDGKTLQTWRARDLIAVAQIFEQTPLASLITPPANATAINHTGLVAHIPLQFEQPGGAVKDKDMTSLPTFAYQKLLLRIEWGDETNIFTDGGTLAGTVTFTAGGATVTQRSVGDLVIGDARAFARRMPIAVNRFIEQAAASGVTIPDIDIGTKANIRGILLVAEGSTGEPSDSVIPTVTLKEDKVQDVYASVPWATLRAENARHYGLTMPTGYAVIDFAKDGDLQRIYRATQKNDVRLTLGAAGATGTVRAALLTIEPPVRV